MSCLKVFLAALFCARLLSAYSFFEYGNGRDDFSTRYDPMLGQMWPSQAAAMYDFGSIGKFATAPPGLTESLISSAVKNAGNAWEDWINVKFGDDPGSAGAGLVRLIYDDTKATGAFTEGYGWPITGGSQPFATITFGKAPSTATPWTADNFTWTLTHELGHVLGLHDLYLAASEEFVDHPVPGNPMPDRRDRQDNLMDRYDFQRLNNYLGKPDTFIDNDEIAGGTWLWGAGHNQIVTGDLAPDWSNGARVAEAHHGDQNNPDLGWWDYRASIVSGGTGKSFIDVYFPGYVTFAAFSHGPTATSWVHVGTPRGPDIHRFETTTDGWYGNVELFVLSQYHWEQRVNAWVDGGREDMFLLPANDKARVFDGTNNWARVFGPVGYDPSVPEPSAAVLFATGVAFLTLWLRTKR